MEFAIIVTIGLLLAGLALGLICGAGQREWTTYEKELDDAAQLEAIRKWQEKHDKEYKKRP